MSEHAAIGIWGTRISATMSKLAAAEVMNCLDKAMWNEVTAVDQWRNRLCQEIWSERRSGDVTALLCFLANQFPIAGGDFAVWCSGQQGIALCLWSAQPVADEIGGREVTGNRS